MKFSQGSLTSSCSPTWAVYFYNPKQAPVETLIQKHKIKDFVNMHNNWTRDAQTTLSLAFPNFWVLDFATLLMFTKHSFVWRKYKYVGEQSFI